MSQFYCLLLDDYSAPSFCSFSKPYYGTLGHLNSFFQAIKADAETAKFHMDMLAAYEQYLEGNKAVCHNVAYQNVPFLKPVLVLGEATSVLTDYCWEHLNTWEYPYHMKCDKAECTHLWLLDDGVYCRCIQVKFTNLFYYKNTVGEFVSAGRSSWGFPHQLEYDPPHTFCRLFVREKMFKSEAEALHDRENFTQNPDPVFEKVLADLFGDG